MLKFGALSGTVAPPQWVGLQEEPVEAGVGVGVDPLGAPPRLMVWGGAVPTHSPLGVTGVTLHLMFEHWSHCAWVYPRWWISQTLFA